MVEISAQYAVYSFVQTGACRDLENLLITDKVDYNSKFGSSKKPTLSLAVESGNVAVVKMLCEYGFDVRETDSNGVSPLHLAVSHGYVDIAKVLLNHGANVNQINGYTRTTPIHLAAERIGDDTEILEVLLEANSSGVNSRDMQGQTPLMRAAVYGHGEKITMLLARGADPTIRDNRGNTAFSLACHYPSVSGGFLEHFFHHEAFFSLINSMDPDGDRAIHVLVRSRSSKKLSAIKTILSHGANVDKTNWTGDTALHLACLEKDYESAKLLILSGCSVNLENAQKQTPLLIAAAKKNDFKMVDLLLKAGTPPPPPMNTGSDVVSPEMEDWLTMKLKEIKSLLYLSRISLAHYRRRSVKLCSNYYDIDNKRLEIPRSLINYLNYEDE